VPQLFGSLVTLLHPLGQHDSPTAHVGPPAHVPAQTEFTHDPPFAQAFPHEPQLFGSLVVSMHPFVPQQVWPTLQLHIGLPHVSPPSGGKLQHCPS